MLPDFRSSRKKAAIIESRHSNHQEAHRSLRYLADGHIEEDTAMKHIGINQARRHLSVLIKLVEAGEDIVITRRGWIVARLVAERGAPRRLPSLAAFRRKIFRLGTRAAALIRAEHESG